MFIPAYCENVEFLLIQACLLFFFDVPEAIHVQRSDTLYRNFGVWPVRAL